MGSAQVRDEARQPGEQAKVHDHRRRNGPRRRIGGGVARRARLQRPQLLHPGFAATRAQHRRAGRHQRREELSERRRQRLSPLLRHGEGRRLSLAGGERLPAGAAERQHHRPVRGAGRAVRARLRRPAGQPIVRRRAGVAHVLRARPDRSAAAARRVSVTDASGAQGHRPTVRAARDARSRARRRARARHRLPQPRHGRNRALRGPRGHSRDGRLRHRVLPVDQRGQLQRHGVVARGQARRPVRQPVLHADPPDVHPGHGRSSVEAHVDEREPPQRRTCVGAEEERRHAAARSDSRRRARLLPGTEVPVVRQSRAARRRVAQREADGRRGARRRRDRSGRLPRFPGRDSAARHRRHPREVREPVPHVQEDHRRGCVQGSDAHLPGDPLHDGRPLGGLQPDDQCPRPARARRSELLGSRRQPPWRVGAHARAGRRLFRRSVHDRPLPRRQHDAESHVGARCVQGIGQLRPEEHQSTPLRERQSRHP